MRYMYTGRMSQHKGILGKFFAVINKHQGEKMGNEIYFPSIGGGCVLAHPYGITMNPRAILGEDVTLFKGCTMGSVRSGSRSGTPIIGDRVTIGCNAMVCGGITVGSDVLISAGAFVNFDVPEHSVVIGNPGVIHFKQNASVDYCF